MGKKWEAENVLPMYFYRFPFVWAQACTRSRSSVRPLARAFARSKSCFCYFSLFFRRFWLITINWTHWQCHLLLVVFVVVLTKCVSRLFRWMIGPTSAQHPQDVQNRGKLPVNALRGAATEVFLTLIHSQVFTLHLLVRVIDCCIEYFRLCNGHQHGRWRRLLHSIQTQNPTNWKSLFFIGRCKRVRAHAKETHSSAVPINGRTTSTKNRCSVEHVANVTARQRTIQMNCFQWVNYNRR